MTFSAFETSENNAHPIELYLFTRGVSYWAYTSADEAKTYSTYTFSPMAMERSNFEQTQEMSRSPITITIDKTCPFLFQYRTSPPTDVVQLKIFRYHESDSEVTVPWIGRVTNVKFKERTADIRCEPIYTSLKRPVLRRRYQTTCPHVLYGPQCGVGYTTYLLTTPLTYASGVTLKATSISAKPDGYYSGGYVEWETGGNIELRFITGHVGDTITLNLPFAGIAAGQQVNIYPGCDHMLTTCNSKFNNVLNYGGQPFYPKKNPFGGSPIY